MLAVTIIMFTAATVSVAFQCQDTFRILKRAIDPSIGDPYSDGPTDVGTTIQDALTRIIVRSRSLISFSPLMTGHFDSTL